MRRRTGFTLIEVMIALFLFGVGMLTLLRAITYFLSMGQEVRQQAQAVALAKEGIDILYNQKDTNLRRGVQRNCAVIDINQTLDACGLYFKAGSSYRV
ncbi:MAG: prepilin-type N-terminal cleavage/methylation domain-containing protein [bacterium]